MMRLREDSSLIGTAADEILGFDSSVQINRRRPKVDVEISGTALPAGSDLLMIIGSANRDETQFDHADRFDVGRTPNRHVAFGTPNIHFCLGAPLARLEVQVAVKTLLKRFPRLALSKSPVRTKRIRFRGFDEMWISI
jgi:cytochrome P450